MTAPLIKMPALLLLHYPGERNHCPLCSGTSWHVGRKISECAGCGCPVSLAGAERTELGDEQWVSP